jgi:hypothetical protein
MMVTAPISVGELFDKITILRVKRARLADPAKRANVAFELDQLEALAREAVPPSDALAALIDALQDVNAALWDIEDGKRDAERRQVFDDTFVALARQVYLRNDERAALKRRINVLTGSAIVEEKSYGDYRPGVGRR